MSDLMFMPGVASNPQSRVVIKEFRTPKTRLDAALNYIKRTLVGYCRTSYPQHEEFDLEKRVLSTSSHAAEPICTASSSLH